MQKKTHTDRDINQYSQHREQAAMTALCMISPPMLVQPFQRRAPRIWLRKQLRQVRADHLTGAVGRSNPQRFRVAGHLFLKLNLGILNAQSG